MKSIRPLTFEQLVQENKHELWADENRISQIEERLENRQKAPLRDKQRT